MLCLMCGKTRRDYIRNDIIRKGVELASIVEMMVENKLASMFGCLGM